MLNRSEKEKILYKYKIKYKFLNDKNGFDKDEAILEMSNFITDINAYVKRKLSLDRDIIIYKIKLLS
jgi:hypothetical protein